MDILSADIEELKTYLKELGEKAFRADQLFGWLHKNGAVTYDEMTNLPASMREKLNEQAPLQRAVIETMQESAIDGTRKYLFKLHDGYYIESVFMRYQHGLTVCVSSQVGCRMGCRFCASTIGGLSRNLTAGEIVSQIEQIGRDVGERITNVVVMGTGEPLDNYDNLVRFIRLCSDPKGLGISKRNITVSTCGLVENIYRLADEGMPINLALSLHAPTDEKRQEIMPIAKKYPLRDVMEAMVYYFKKTGRRLTFEYSLIKGVNDSDQVVKDLSRLLRGKNALINVIPVNPVREREFKDTSRPETEAFKKKLEKNGLHVTIRREMGRDIDGACGQLRKKYIETE
ncbi:MAG: 23S rRNA (adenine(2503)-C(2))-methyltransferase RlmN [Lachnospiraceae bacterium]|nr:23S rRNA (adenine(2503)-C(2))-methyltransferase RlmN [Candidatus Equihabitans merdae]